VVAVGVKDLNGKMHVVAGCEHEPLELANAQKGPTAT